MQRTELQLRLDALLECGRFNDYCPNGLQVEGRAEIRKIVCGVTASRALIEAAIVEQADAIVVHHGWFWRGEEQRLTGFRRERMRLLLNHDINLFAYHLPLDAHPVLGNNAQLAHLLGCQLACLVVIGGQLGIDRSQIHIPIDQYHGKMVRISVDSSTLVACSASKVLKLGAP